MSLRQRAQADSLELLLNTMCSAFGGIVMISLLMALLTGDSSTENPTVTGAAQEPRELDQAMPALNEARRVQSLLSTNVIEVTYRLALAAELERLAAQIKNDLAAVQSNRSISATAPATDPIDISALLERKAALETEARALGDQLDRARQARQRLLRLPRERATGKKPFYLIVRHGRIYPIQIIRDGERAMNTETLTWSELPDGRIATPYRNIPANVTVPPLARQLRDISNQTYSIHFLVYEDSFPAFLAARQLPLQAGFDTGWEFLTNDRPVLFSSGGEAPPAL